MSIVDIFFSGQLWFAIVVFTFYSTAVEIIGSRILQFLADVPVSEWIFDRLLIPLARAVGIMIFILLSYPVIFGISEAPPLSELLAAGSHRISTLMNIVFVLPLLFSMIPVIGKVPAFLLPVQAIAGTTLVFSWMQAALNANRIHYLPDAVIILTIILLAMASHWVARPAAIHLAAFVNQRLRINDGQKIVYRIAVVIAQLPVVLIYTTALGAQL